MDKIEKLFSTEQGKKIYLDALRAISEYKMQPMIEKGVLVGLSGGADSVMLLCFLIELRRKNGYFPIAAVHINHMIRKGAADKDEEYSRTLCESLNIEFTSKSVDVPTLAKCRGQGLEECARNVRYSEFSSIISGRSDISTLSVAHNSNDNLETVLLNILRGAGAKGAAGIPPVRDNIIRPLIYTKKADILQALDEAGIYYVTDATNFENDYRRNFLRNEIVTRLQDVFDYPEYMAARLSANLRCDDEYITLKAYEFVNSNNPLTISALRKLHKAVFIRVISILSSGVADTVSASVLEDLYNLVLKKDKFSYSLPGNAKFIAEGGLCKIVKADDIREYDYLFNVANGKTELCGFDADFFVFGEKLDKASLNVYNFSIHADISSAIIEGNLYLRPRKDGDALFFGGMTRKVKKLFSDRKIPESLRGSIPLLCDGRGVVWVPGCGVRDDVRDKSSRVPCYVALAIGKGDELHEYRMRSASEYKS
ncbi:MAG: tRNA lysidine(34) synthetase TilS [Clostridia bacterium]|nr:tRNA lysidine(34) synthetase TilS [Clostridia bacterium]